MKKLLICLIGAIILSNCEIKPKEANAQGNYGEYGYGKVTTKEYEFEGMKYVVFISSGKYEVSTFVVNITRDKLQTEIMSINIKKAKDGKGTGSE